MKLLLSFILATIFVSPHPNGVNGELYELNLSSENYILYSIDSNSVIASKNEDEPVAAASINKVLTVITALELLDNTPLDTIYTIPFAVFDGLDSNASIAGFWPDEDVSIEDLIYGSLLASGADATRALSYYLTKTPEGLAEAMNKTAKRIGMNNTSIVNTSGLDAKNQYTTLNDLLTLIQYALNNPDFKKMYTTKNYSTLPTYQHPEGLEFNNRILMDTQISNFPYLYGAKSGYTTMAGMSLSSIAKNEELDFIFISTQATVDFGFDYALADAIKVYHYLFENYTLKPLLKSQDPIFEIQLKRRKDPFPIMIETDLEAVLPKDFDENLLQVEVNFDESLLKAPIKKDVELGTWSLIYDGKLIYTETYITPEKISKGLLYKVFDILIVLALLLLLLILIRQINYRRRRRYRY